MHCTLKPRKTVPDGIHPIDDVGVQILLRDRAAFEVDHVIADEPCRKPLLACGIREKIARKLPSDEFVPAQVVVERLDDPCAPWPHVASGIEMITVRIRVPREIEPAHRHFLTVPWRSEEAVGEALDACAAFSRRGRRLPLRDEVVDLLRTRGQPREVEGYPSEDVFG
jgi:hypothetical protein